MPTLSVRHQTLYRYAQPVTFGEHRLMIRPRDSFDLRLISTGLAVSPRPAATRWLHDAFGNSICVLSFADRADVLSIESTLTLEHVTLEKPDFPVEEFARRFPFSYAMDERPDIERSIERHYPDEGHLVDAFSRRFLEENGTGDTIALLTSMNAAIKADFAYVAREIEGTQSPAETLTRQQGTCRDFALLMMEAARSLGFAARFVTGYLYTGNRDADAGQLLGSGATHAWAQIYLPGAGWVEFDPTNALVGGRDLIRIAVARDPRQAIPVQGSFTGLPSDFLDMEVHVEVTAI